MKTLHEDLQELDKRLQELIKAIRDVPSVAFIEKLMRRVLSWLEKILS